MSLLRNAVARPATRLAAGRPVARPIASSAAPRIARPSIRSYAIEQPTTTVSPVHSHTPMWIVLGVLVSGIGAGYIYTKPIRELAQKAHTAIDTAKAGTDQASNLGSQVASLAGLGPAFAISQTLYAKINEHGGVSQFVSGLSEDFKNSDVDSVIRKIKEVGGKDVEPYVAQVESALKEAKGKVQDVDWKSLLSNIEEHVGDEWKGAISYIQKAIPASGPFAVALASGDWSSITEKIKAEGGDSLKELESTAKKLYNKASEINKDKKASLDDLIKSLKETDAEDLDNVIKQVKDVAKKAGIPADQIESWVASKGGKIDTEQLVRQVRTLAEMGQGKLEGAANLVDSDKVVTTVKSFSPALASLLSLTLAQAGAKLGSEGKDAAKDGKAQYESTKKQIQSLSTMLKSAAGNFSGDLEKRVTRLTDNLQKTIDEAPSVEATKDAAKDSAKAGEKTASAEAKQKEWEQAIAKMKDQVKREFDGLRKDLEKEVGEGKKGEAAKKALDLAKGFLG